jgi:hypothetical protein
MTVDDTTLDLFANITDALKGLAAAVEQVEARITLLEKKQTILEQFSNVRIINNER